MHIVQYQWRLHLYGISSLSLKGLFSAIYVYTQDLQLLAELHEVRAALVVAMEV